MASERMTRKRIRNRLGAAMLDLSTILEALPDEDLDNAFIERIKLGYGVSERPRQHISDAIGVLYLGSIATEESLGARGLEPIRTARSYRSPPLVNPMPFENRAEKGIERALIRRGIDVSDVSVTVNIADYREIEKRNDDLRDLPVDQLKRLNTAGEITEKEYLRARARQLGMEPNELSADPDDMFNDCE